MIISIILKSKNSFLVISMLVLGLTGLCFVADQDWLTWSNQCLVTSYDVASDTKLKKFEISLNKEAFLRLRKTYQNGKQEYFSLQLQQLDDLNYLGNIYKGTLRFKTKEDDIIVQTYNDRKGNIDSMATTLDIPIKNMEPERLDSLQQAISYLKAKGL